MKLRKFAFLLTMAITLSIFTGCGRSTAERQPDSVEQSGGNGTNTTKDTVENSAESVGNTTDSTSVSQNTQSQTGANMPNNTATNMPGNTPSNTSGNTPGNTPSNTPGNTPSNTQTASLTEEEAVTIALEHGGFTQDQVKYLHTEYEIDNGIPQYEVEFHQGRLEYDYVINAETGNILSFSKDD